MPTAKPMRSTPSCSRVAQHLVCVGLLASSVSVSAQVQQPPLWTLTRDVRFGSETDMTAAVIQPQTVIVAPNGNTLIFDYRTRQLKVFGPAGTFVRVIGRQGQGPGEFGRVIAMGYLGDTLWTADPELRRITLFPPGGGDPTTFPFRYEPAVIGTLMGAMPQGFLRGGLIVAQGVLSPRGSATGGTIESPIVLMRRDGTIADTLAKPVIRTAPDVTVRSITSTGTQRTNIAGQPFLAEPFWRARADGRGVVLVSTPPPVTAGNAAFTIQAFDTLGREIRSRSYPYVPMPVTDRLRDSVINGMATVGGATAFAEVRAELKLAPLVPAVTDLRVGRDGSAWLRRERYRDGWLLWNVIDPGGALVARVMMPARAMVAYADMEQVLLQESDGDGVTWIVRYRLTRPAR